MPGPTVLAGGNAVRDGVSTRSLGGDGWILHAGAVASVIAGNW